MKVNLGISVEDVDNESNMASEHKSKKHDSILQKYPTDLLSRKEKKSVEEKEKEKQAVLEEKDHLMFD